MPNGELVPDYNRDVQALLSPAFVPAEVYAGVLTSRNVAKAAELAWFYAFHRPDKEKAARLAELATSVPNATSLAAFSLSGR